MYVRDDMVFLAIPKTGSMSLRRALKSHGFVKHGRHHYVEPDREFYGERRVFAVVRNPYSRAISAWDHIVSKHCPGFPHLNERPWGWFIESLASRKWLAKSTLLRPQTRFLKRCPRPATALSYEELPDCLSPVIGSVEKFPTRNRGQRDRTRDLEMLTERAVKVLSAVYSKDFQRLGYSTDPEQMIEPRRT